MKLPTKVVIWISRTLDLRIVVPGNPGRIGHLALDFDAYIKWRLLAGRSRKPVWLVDETTPIANKCLFEYWRSYISVIQGRKMKAIRALVGINAAVTDDLAQSYASVLDGPSPCYTIEAEWGERSPLLSLNPEHARRGEECLKALGIPPNSWFVCVHARGPGYSTFDEHLHSYRNSSIETYVLAMQTIVARGGWCVRIGDSTMEPMPSIPRVVDYALSPFKSDWMDIFLCAKCRFFLGSSSGVSLVSTAFGVPSALVNMAPIGAVYMPFRSDLSIPKLTFDRDGTPISFPDLLASPVSIMRETSQFDREGVTLAPSSPDDIAALGNEMMDRLDGTFVASAGDERRQNAFRGLMRPRHYSWGACSRIGSDFLRKYESLLAGRNHGRGGFEG